MKPSATPKNFNAIFHMLIELALGDLSFRIPAEENSLEYKLNNFAANLENEIKAADNPLAEISFSGLVQDIIIINDEFVIRAFNHAFADRLSYQPQKLIGLQIKQIVTKGSQEIIEILKIKLESKKPNTIGHILFLTADDLIIPAACSITTVHGTTDFIITSVTVNSNDRASDKTVSSSVLIPQSSDDIATKLYNYILQNLGKPLPTTKQLCKNIGTNEFTLKDSFKKKYNSSIYQFYNDERLKRAHLMIQQTNLALKEIAYNSGFNDYVNFSKAFKKKYTYTPGQLYRKEGQK